MDPSTPLVPPFPRYRPRGRARCIAMKGAAGVGREPAVRLAGQARPGAETGADGGGEPPLLAVATPWDDGSWALVVPPGSDAATLANAARRLPAGCQFVEAYGDVETVLVYRLLEQSDAPAPDPPAVELGVKLAAGAHPLAQVRARRGWSYQTLARVLASRARAQGVNMAAERQKPWRWEHHGVTPDRVTQQLLATELGVPVEMTDLRPWPGWLPTAAGPSYDQVVEQLTAEIEKGVQALAALGYTAVGVEYSDD